MKINTTNTDKFTVHGNLVVLYSIGVLIQGPARIGKSELTLKLLDRGHAMVADDAIEVRSRSNQLIGQSPALNGGYLLLPSLGLLDVALLFGKTAVKKRTAIHFVIRLTPSQEKITPPDPLQPIIKENTTILGVSLPLYSVSIHSSLDLVLWMETVVRLHKRSTAHGKSIVAFNKKFNEAKNYDSKRN